MQAQSWFVWLVRLVVLGSALLQPVSTARAAQPASPVASPISGICDVATTRSIDEVRALIVQGLREGAARRAARAASPVATPAPVVAATAATPAGVPADPATEAAVIDTITTYFACLNEGRLAAAYSLMPDSWVSRAAAGIVYGFASAVIGEEVDPLLISPETIDALLPMIYYSSGPLPADQQAQLLAVEDVRDLGGGLVQVTVTLVYQGSGPQTSTMELQRTADDYILVDSLEPSPAAATPGAAP